MQLKSLEDTQKFSKNISSIVEAGDVIFLYGEIGVGKTTFVRFFINFLETQKGISNSEVLSPTFNIVYDYDIGEIKILHYDLYRLKNYKDISQLGMFENLKNHIKIVHYDLYRLKNYRDISQLGMFEISKDYIKIVEWPELIESKPKDRIDILFHYSKNINSRNIEIKGFGKWKDYKFNEI